MKKKIERTLKFETMSDEEKYIEKDDIVRMTRNVVLKDEDKEFTITHKTIKSENEFRELKKMDKTLEIKMILMIQPSAQKKITDEVDKK